MAWTYNPPPNWPPPPPGWSPPPGWRPNPAWGPPPPGWQLWIRGAAVPYGVVARPRSRPPSTPLMVALPTVSLGVASFVPLLWAATLRRGDKPYQRLMVRAAFGIAAVAVLGWILYAKTGY